jgi:FkbM family methyltransferase
MFIDLGFSDEERAFIRNRDIIDAGAFTGDTAIPLSEITDKNVYAFEPFSESFELLNRNVDDNNIENIIPVNMSLGDINGERTLFLTGNNVQGITNDPNIRKHDTELKVEETTIDKFVEDNGLDVGLISVDVEGAELDLLRGAVETIKSQKPILTISIYHKASDFIEIIPWIANLGLGYEFEIEKDHPWPFLADTVVKCKTKFD